MRCVIAGGSLASETLKVAHGLLDPSGISKLELARPKINEVAGRNLKDEGRGVVCNALRH